MPENDPKKEIIKKIIAEKKPESIKQAIFLVHEEFGIPEKEIFFAIQELNESKELFLDELKFPESVTDYLFSLRGAWYWLIMFLSFFTVILIFLVPENSFPQIYARNFLGLLFVAYLPGYSVIKTLYPISLPVKTRYLTLDTVERIVLSLGLSLSITPLVGLILYNTPFGLNLEPVTISLFALTTFFATLGLFREYQARKAMFLRRVILVSDYEFVDDTIRFFSIQGLINKRRIILKEIPVGEISSIDSYGNELSVTSTNGIAHIFYLNRNQSFVELKTRIRDIINKRAQ